MKIVHIVLKVLFSIILIMPVLGVTGVFPPATRDLYNTDLAFAFIEMLTAVVYITYIMAVVHVIALIALWTRREALAALLVLPITVNVFAFHLMIDGGAFTAGASLGNLMLLLNLYLLWKNRDAYQSILQSR